MQEGLITTGKVIGVIALIVGALWFLQAWSDSKDRENWRQVEEFCDELLGNKNHPLYDRCNEKAYETFHPDAGYSSE